MLKIGCSVYTNNQSPNEAIRHGPLLAETVGDTDGSRESTDTVAVGTCDSKLLGGYVAVGVTDTVARKVDTVGSMPDIVLAFVLSF